MFNKYAERYINLGDFIKYCQELGVYTDEQELEFYEEKGLILPVARVVKPFDVALHEYDIRNNKVPSSKEARDYKRLNSPKSFSFLVLSGSEIKQQDFLEIFDLEFERENSCLVKPRKENYRPWKSYVKRIKIGKDKWNISLVEHYYAYWQVHDLYTLQQSSLAYFQNGLPRRIKTTLQKYIPVIKNLRKNDNKPTDNALRKLQILLLTLRIFSLWFYSLIATFLYSYAQKFDPNQTHPILNGNTKMYDVLLNFINFFEKETNRTFRNVSSQNGWRILDDTQATIYQQRLLEHAEFALNQSRLTIPELEDFLVFLVRKYEQYRKSERVLLATEVKKDILRLVEFITLLKGRNHRLTIDEWELLSSQYFDNYSPFKGIFKSFQPGLRVRQDAKRFLEFYFSENDNEFASLNSQLQSMGKPKITVDEFVRFCENNNLIILLYNLYQLMNVEKEEESITKYIVLKNLASSLEYLLKELAAVANPPIPLTPKDTTLGSIVPLVMKNEPWISRYSTGQTNKKTRVENIADVLSLLSDIDSINDTWAKLFLKATLTRNLVIHNYPTDIWFYGEPYNGMLNAVVYSIMYSWFIARREGWV